MELSWRGGQPIKERFARHTEITLFMVWGDAPFIAPENVHPAPIETTLLRKLGQLVVSSTRRSTAGEDQRKYPAIRDALPPQITDKPSNVFCQLINRWESVDFHVAYPDFTKAIECRRSLPERAIL
jgi:hypothetical protein